MAQHPPPLDAVFGALSDPIRRLVIAEQGRGLASSATWPRLSPMTLPSFMKHIRTLESTGLIRTAKTGRVRTCTLDRRRLAVVDGWLGRADALLLGRRTYAAFALAWPQITDPDDPFTEAMNGLPKYVTTHTLTDTTWSPSTILGGDVVTEVAALKARPGRELQIHGSARLAQTLLAAALIDEVRLVVSPTVVGQGRRLFPTEGPAVGLRVTHSSTTPGGLTILELETTGTADLGTYEGVRSVIPSDADPASS